MSYLPESVIISPDGEIIWQGKPNEMSFSKIKSIISRPISKTVSIKKKIKNPPLLPIIRKCSL